MQNVRRPARASNRIADIDSYGPSVTPQAVDVLTATWAELVRHSAGKLISSAGLQVMAQFTNLVTGVVILRMLNIVDYGIYVLIAGYVGSISVMSDAGIGTSVMHSASTRTPDLSLHTIFLSAINSRARLLVPTLITTLPLLSWALHRMKCSELEIGAVLLLVCLQAYIGASASVLGSIARVEDRFPALLRIELTVAAFKLVAIFALLRVSPNWLLVQLVTCLSLEVATRRTAKMLALSIPSLGYRFSLRRRPGVDPDSHLMDLLQTKHWTTVKRVLPTSIYGAAASNAPGWVAAYMGLPELVGLAGAVSRVAQVFAVVNGMISGFLIPRFARTEFNRISLRPLNFAIFLLSLLTFPFIILVHFFPTLIPLVFGNKLQSRGIELTIALVTVSITSCGGVSQQFAAVRNWLISPLIYVLLSMPFLLVGLVIDPATPVGNLSWMAAICLGNLLIYYPYVVIRIRSKVKEQ